MDMATINEHKEEVIIYPNDKFGLPPVYNPEIADSELALDLIKSGKKLEKKGDIKGALIKYKGALQFLQSHKGLKKLIKKLELSSVISYKFYISL